MDCVINDYLNDKDKRELKKMLYFYKPYGKSSKHIMKLIKKNTYNKNIINMFDFLFSIEEGVSYMDIYDYFLIFN